MLSFCLKRIISQSTHKSQINHYMQMWTHGCRKETQSLATDAALIVLTMTSKTLMLQSKTQSIAMPIALRETSKTMISQSKTPLIAIDVASITLIKTSKTMISWSKTPSADDASIAFNCSRCCFNRVHGDFKIQSIIIYSKPYTRV